MNNVWEMVRALLVVGMTILLVGCHKTQPSSQTVSVSMENGSDQNVSVKAGQEFVIVLPSNPSTGYQWRVGAVDEAVLKLVGTEFIRPVNPAGMVGVPGKRKWVFRGVKAGTATIVLEEVRPWEKDVPPVRVARYQVTVQ